MRMYDVEPVGTQDGAQLAESDGRPGQRNPGQAPAVQTHDLHAAGAFHGAGRGRDHSDGMPGRGEVRCELLEVAFDPTQARPVPVANERHAQGPGSGGRNSRHQENHLIGPRLGNSIAREFRPERP